MNRLFQSAFSGFPSDTDFFGGWNPTLDVYEEKDEVVAKAELPGMKKEDLEISVQDGVLTISGERKEEEELKDAETYRSERFFGKFHRSLALPATVDPSKVKAAYKDGVLTVTLPKKEEAKPKTIDIEVS